MFVPSTYSDQPIRCSRTQSQTLPTQFGGQPGPFLPEQFGGVRAPETFGLPTFVEESDDF